VLAPAADDIEVFWGDLEGNPSLHGWITPKPRSFRTRISLTNPSVKQSRLSEKKEAGKLGLAEGNEEKLPSHDVGLPFVSLVFTKLGTFSLNHTQRSIRRLSSLVRQHIPFPELNASLSHALTIGMLIPPYS
jgi:hypothetical protein